MKKYGCLVRVIAIVLSFFMIWNCGISSVKAQEDSTTGIKADLTISSSRELREFAQKVNSGNSYEGKLIKLTDDIVFDGITVNNFTPIGSGNGFQGTFDGDEHSIIGIDITNQSDAGLFGNVGTLGTVKNVIIKNSDIRGDNAAGIAACNYGTVENCHNVGTKITCTDEYGAGIVGENKGTVLNCSSSGEIFSEAEKGSSKRGGIVGYNYHGNIFNSCNTGNVSGIAGYTGGIVAKSWSGTIQNCYNTGMISGGTYGGIVGSLLYHGIVANCYSSEEGANVNFSEMKGTEKNNRALPESEMNKVFFVNLLNANRGSNSNWLEWEFRSSSEFPQLKRLTDISGFTATLEADHFAYTENAIEPSVTVICGGRVLSQGIDYDVIYRDNIDRGTAEMIIIGKGRYKGSITKTFEIQKRQQEISCTPYYKKSYGSSTFSLNAKLKTGNGTLKYQSSDSKVATINSHGTVTIHGTGRTIIKITASATEDYEKASVNITLDVQPQKQDVKIKSVRKKKMTVKWTKDIYADGYVIQYGTSKKLAKSGKVKTIDKRKTTSTVIKNLKNKKTYYLRVRSFKNVQMGGNTIRLYGSWSKIQKVNVSKKHG